MTAKLENIKNGASVRGIASAQPVQIVSVDWIGDQAINVVYRDHNGSVAESVLYRDDEHRLEVEQDGRPWSFDADGALLRLVTEANRKQLIGNALKALAGGSRTKDAVAVLDALEMLDGDRIDPSRSRYTQEILSRLKAKGHGQVLNRSELLSGATDVEYFHPTKFRLEPDLLATLLSGNLPLTSPAA